MQNKNTNTTNTKNVVSNIKQVYKKWNPNYLQFSDLQKGYFSIDSTLKSHVDDLSVYGRALDAHCVRLSDFGYTLFHLDTLGIKLSQSKPVSWYIFTDTLKTYHVHLLKKSETLYVDANLKSIPAARINLLKAMIHIRDIAYMFNHKLIRERLKH